MDNTENAERLVPLRLNSKVISKKTGLPGTGTLIGILSAEYVFHNSGPKPRWNELYPDWGKKPVAVVLMDNPQRNLSYEEYLTQSGSTDNFFTAMGYKLIPVYSVQNFPIDDLEPFED